MSSVIQAGPPFNKTGQICGVLTPHVFKNFQQLVMTTLGGECELVKYLTFTQRLTAILITQLLLAPHVVEREH